MTRRHRVEYTGGMSAISVPSARVMTGARCIVTGATSGIGKHTALELAKRGAHVTLVSRNRDRCQNTQDWIESLCPSARIDFETCDLSLQRDIVALAGRLVKQRGSIDVLVNNAGAIFGRRMETAEGIEQTWALNHLAYFALTQRLLPMLATDGRIINISSESHRAGRLRFSDLEWRHRRYKALPAYMASKLANVMFTYELARRLKDSPKTTYAMCPGPVNTGFATGRAGVTGLAYRVARWAMPTAETACATAVQLCAEPQEVLLGGEYYVKGKTRRSSRPSYDTDAAAELWARSEEQVAEALAG